MEVSSSMASTSARAPAATGAVVAAKAAAVAASTSSTHFQDVRRFTVDLCVGGVSAAISKTAVAPIERVKLLLQVQNSHSGISVEHRYRGIIDCFLRVPKEQGFASFWRGNLTNVSRYFPTQALNFAFNDLYKRSFLSNLDKSKDFWRYSMWSLAAGGCAGSTTLCFVYPLDLVRTRLSVDVGADKSTREYKGFMDCTKKTIQYEGVTGLYRGFFISIQTYFIYRAVYFGMYDVIRNLLRRDGKPLPFIASYAVAQGVSVCSAMITYPWDTVRRRMMIESRGQDAAKVFAEQGSMGHAFRVAKKIVVKEGVGGLFKGALANVFRTAGGALVMAIYEEIHKFL